MRPIDKGPCPTINGIPKTVSDHKDWRLDLINRLGPYCCYCNIPLPDSPQVEHVIAQNISPTLKLDWGNLLLACGPCNRTKSAKPCPPTTHYLPEYHNTHLAFIYAVSPMLNHGEPAAYVQASTSANAAKAENTINLCALSSRENLVLSIEFVLSFDYQCFMLKV